MDSIGTPTLASRVKRWARALKRDVVAVYFAARDPRVPWYAKVVALAVAGYALSPIDLIPDFIPVLGYLDDLVIVPLGLLLAVKLIPPDVMRACRRRAEKSARRPISKVAAAVVVAIWLLAAGGAAVVLLGVSF